MIKKYLSLFSIILCIFLLASCSPAGTGETHTESGSVNDGPADPSVDSGNDDNADDDYDVIIPGGTDEGTTDHNHVYGEGNVIAPTFEAGGYTEYTCKECGATYKDSHTAPLSHSFSEEWYYNETIHWNACTDEGYASLVGNESEHIFKDEIITDSTPDATGLMSSTCTVCNYSLESVIPRKTHIVTLPTVNESFCRVGMPLSMIALSGGEGSVAGSFSWSDPNMILSENGNYEVTFTPADPDDAKVTATVSIKATWITVSVSTSENGNADIDSDGKVSYGEDVTVYLSPRFGYTVDTFTLNGVKKGCKSSYVIENVTEDKNVYVSFRKSDNPVTLTCLGGNDNCYSIDGNTLTISGISSDTIYSISGEAYGNIVIDVDPAYKFELELAGFSITCSTAAPISIINGDKVTISAKKSFTNYVNDMRPAGVSGSTPETFPASIYSLIDLDVEGKGNLTVTSKNNGGIYSKKDVDVKNLTLSVTCQENALRGNDSVTVTGGSMTLIATHGDAIKTNNSDISSKGNQRGDVTIVGGIHNIYAAGDGISAAHDVLISDTSTVLNVYTDTFSTHSDLKTEVSKDKMFIRSESADYSFSLKFTKKDGSVSWSDTAYIGEQVIDGTTYYFYEAARAVGYTHVSVYSYDQGQTQGQDASYHLTTYEIPLAKGNDTIAIKILDGVLGFRYTGYQLTENGNVSVDERSNRGIKSANGISISGGTISISSHGDAIKANNDSILENGKKPTGNIVITAGSITITTYATGILAEGNLTISGGSITVNESFTGLSGDVVNTTGAATSIVAIYKSVK